jgi:disulfide bond formation protein DsbB
MGRRGVRVVALSGAGLGAAALAVALGSQHGLGLVPCALCYVERWPYRFAIGLGLLGAVLPRQVARPVCWLMVLAFVAAAAAAFVHTGVELHWWKSPLPECTAPDLRGLSVAERLAQMPARPTKECEDPDYLIPGIPLSMAQMNLLFALASAGFLAMWLGRTARRRR